MDEEIQQPQPKISFVIGILGVITFVIFDILSFIPGAGDVLDAPAGVVLVLSYIGGLSTAVVVTQAIVDILKAIPIVQLLPLWTPAWLFTWYIESHPSRLTAVVEQIAQKEELGTGGEGGIAAEGAAGAETVAAEAEATVAAEAGASAAAGAEAEGAAAEAGGGAGTTETGNVRPSETVTTEKKPTEVSKEPEESGQSEEGSRQPLSEKGRIDIGAEVPEEKEAEEKDFGPIPDEERQSNKVVDIRRPQSQTEVERSFTEQRKRIEADEVKKQLQSLKPLKSATDDEKEQENTEEEAPLDKAA